MQVDPITVAIASIEEGIAARLGEIERARGLVARLVQLRQEMRNGDPVLNLHYPEFRLTQRQPEPVAAARAPEPERQRRKNMTRAQMDEDDAKVMKALVTINSDRTIHGHPTRKAIAVMALAGEERRTAVSLKRLRDAGHIKCYGAKATARWVLPDYVPPMPPTEGEIDARVLKAISDIACGAARGRQTGKDIAWIATGGDYAAALASLHRLQASGLVIRTGHTKASTRWVLPEEPRMAAHG